MTITTNEILTDVYTVHDLAGLDALPAGAILKPADYGSKYTKLDDGTYKDSCASPHPRTFVVNEAPLQLLNLEILGNVIDEELAAWELELLGTDAGEVELKIGDQVRFVTDYNMFLREERRCPVGTFATVTGLPFDGDGLFAVEKADGVQARALRERFRKVTSGPAIVGGFKKGDRVLVSQNPTCVTAKGRNGGVFGGVAGKIGTVIKDDAKLFALGNVVVKFEDQEVWTQFIAPEHLSIVPKPKFAVDDRVYYFSGGTSDETAQQRYAGTVVEVIEGKETKYLVQYDNESSYPNPIRSRESYFKPLPELEPIVYPVFKVGDRVVKSTVEHFISPMDSFDYAEREAMKGQIGVIDGKGGGANSYSVRWDTGGGSIISATNLALAPLAVGDKLTLAAQLDELPKFSAVVQVGAELPVSTKLGDGTWARFNKYAEARVDRGDVIANQETYLKQDIAFGREVMVIHVG